MSNDDYINRLEPIKGQPGWYYDPVTGNTHSEEELSGIVDPEEGAEENYDMHEDYDSDEEDMGGGDSEEESREDPSPNDNPKDTRDKNKNSDDNQDNNNDEGGGEGSNLDSLAADHMGKAGEAYNKVKELTKDAEDIAKIVETEGADLAADYRIAKKYGKEAVKTSFKIQITLFAAVLGIICLFVGLFAMALLGFGDSSSTSYQPGDMDTVEKGKGYTLKDNTDYSSIPCAEGTTDSGTYTHPIKNFTIRLCGTAVGKVASINSTNIANLITASKRDGIIFGGSSFRSYEDQIALRKANCPNWQTSRSSDCHPPTAIAGNSMHEMGLATDFSINGSYINTRSSEGFIWLSKNASKYIYYNFAPEPWHWSTTGG